MGMQGTYVAISKHDLEAIEKDANEVLNIDSNIRLDIDKSWQALHYTLTGDLEDGEPPMSYVVPTNLDNSLDLEVPDLETFILTNKQVKEAYQHMTTIDKGAFSKMYNLENMVEDGVYPLSSADLEDEPNNFMEYLYENLEAIKAFYKQAIEEDKAVVFYIS